MCINKICLFIFLSLNCTNLKNKEIFDAPINIEEAIKEEIFSFNGFFNNFDKNSRLFNNKNYVYYINDDVFYYFDLYTKNKGEIKISKDLTNAYTCFFNGFYLYLATSEGVFIFDLNGNVVSECNFANNCKNLVFHPKNIVIKEDLIYIFSFDNKISLFNSDYNNEKNIKLIWLNNDLYDPFSIFNFKYIFDNEKIYVFHKNRLCILNALTGTIIKNIYLDRHYDDISIKNNILIFYTNKSYAYLDLTEFYLKESDDLFLNGEQYIINSNNLIYKEKKYDFVYIRKFITSGMFFAYKNLGKKTIYFLINTNGLCDNVIIENFNITEVFFYENKIVLIDVKNGKFKIL